MLQKNLLAILLVMLVAACNNNDKNKPADKEIAKKIDKASWLVGTWQNNTPESRSTEIWEKENDSTYKGRSYTIAGKDTVFSETFTLEEINDSLFYVPLVKEQNEGLPIRFALTSISDKQLVFEKPEHDYPQKITYTKITDDSLVAEISGMLQGKQTAQQFPMKKTD